MELTVAVNSFRRLQVEFLIRPEPDTTRAVQLWLAKNAIESTSISSAGDWLGFNISVKQANTLFQADYKTYYHVKSGTSAIRTLMYTLPTEISHAVNLVHPATSYARPSTCKCSQLQVLSTYS